MLPMLTISSRSWVWTLAAPTLALTVYSLIEYFSMTFNRCVIHKNLLLGFQNYATALKLLVAECHNWSDHARPVMHVFPTMCNIRTCMHFFQLLCHAILISVFYGITEFQIEICWSKTSLTVNLKCGLGRGAISPWYQYSRNTVNSLFVNVNSIGNFGLSFSDLYFKSTRMICLLALHGFFCLFFFFLHVLF